VRYRFVVDVGRKADGRRDQRTQTFDTLRRARVELARIIAERAAGVLVRPDRQLTVAGFLSEWLESKRGRRPATYQGYLHALRPVIQRYGNLPLQALEVPHLAALKRACSPVSCGGWAGPVRRCRAGAPLSARTVNYLLTAVSSALRAALRRRLVAVNVGECVERVERDPDAGPERVGWQAEQVRAFLAHVRGHRLYAAFLLFCCGLRRGEVLKLQLPAVVLTGGAPALTVRWNRVQVGNQVHEHGPKSRASRRTLPLSEPVAAALAGLLVRQRRERATAGPAYRPGCPRCGQVHVVVAGLGLPYRPEWYSDEFDRQVRAAGLPRVPLHGVRHAPASLLEVSDVAFDASIGGVWERYAVTDWVSASWPVFVSRPARHAVG
jgi:integrase